MSVIQHDFFPRSMFNLDNWLTHKTHQHGTHHQTHQHGIHHNTHGTTYNTTTNVMPTIYTICPTTGKIMPITWTTCTTTGKLLPTTFITCPTTGRTMSTTWMPKNTTGTTTTTTTDTANITWTTWPVATNVFGTMPTTWTTCPVTGKSIAVTWTRCPTTGTVLPTTWTSCTTGKSTPTTWTWTPFPTTGSTTTPTSWTWTPFPTTGSATTPTTFNTGFSQFPLLTWTPTTDVTTRPTGTTLEMFDAFDLFDHMLSKNMEWLQKPSFMPTVSTLPTVPDKYRVTIDITGFSPKSIKTEFTNGQLVVVAHEETKNTDGDFHVKQFKKTFKIPQNCQVDKMASFVAGSFLVVEIPMHVTRTGTVGDDLLPHVVENMDGTTTVKLTTTFPSWVEPSKVNVTCKDRDVIIRAEDTTTKQDTTSKSYMYKRCTLPENTDFHAMKCHYENGKMQIEAPIQQALTSTPMTNTTGTHLTKTHPTTTTATRASALGV